MKSAWSRKDFLYEIAVDYVRRVNEMANGRLKLELLTAGTVAGAYQMLDAVSAGTLDVSLLGMAYLDRFAGIEIAGDRMRLRR